MIYSLRIFHLTLLVFCEIQLSKLSWHSWRALNAAQTCWLYVLLRYICNYVCVCVHVGIAIFYLNWLHKFLANTHTRNKVAVGSGPVGKSSVVICFGSGVLNTIGDWRRAKRKQIPFEYRQFVPILNSKYFDTSKFLNELTINCTKVEIFPSEFASLTFPARLLLFASMKVFVSI